MRIKTLVDLLFQEPLAGTTERFIAAGAELDVADVEVARMIEAGEAVPVEEAVYQPTGMTADQTEVTGMVDGPVEVAAAPDEGKPITRRKR